VKGKHLLLVVHIYLDLLGRLGVGNGVAVADFNLGAIFAAGAEEGANDAFLVGGAAEGVVEDGEDGLFKTGQRVGHAAMYVCTGLVAYLGLDSDVQRGSRWLMADGRWAERARQVEERVVLGHCSDRCWDGAAECW
jgi:hypothetical protein